MHEPRTFSAREALRLLGREVRSCLERDGIPSGAQGRVVRIRRGGRCATGFTVGLRWYHGREEELTKAEFECYVAVDAAGDENSIHLNETRP